MPLTTNFAPAPYFDDSVLAEAKGYYKILFQPKVSVQVRELNQLQTLLQNQVEKFGDSIYQVGTIISGCNFGFSNAYSYVKINDLTQSGLSAVPSNYVDLIATNQNGVQATILDYLNGYQSTDPNLKTLYLNYTSSGLSGTGIFSPQDVLTLTGTNNCIFDVNIVAAGQNFSNSDTVVFVPAVTVVGITGKGFQAGEVITSPGGGKGIVISTNPNLIHNKTVIYLSASNTDLTNLTLTTTPWILSSNVVITGQTSGTTARTADILGRGASAQVITDGNGRVIDIVMTDVGMGYVVAPFTTIKPAFTPTALSTGLNLQTQNYAAQVVVASTSKSVGNGYAMTISSGVIYQKGYFIEVSQQTAIISPYSSSPNNISVVFKTAENIITPFIDPSLFDNALGSPNYIAPGANRVQLVPSLYVANTDYLLSNGVSDGLILVSFSDGLPYQQNQYTAFNSVAVAMAQQQFETAGNFVLDPWKVTTSSPSQANANTIALYVDPGIGYIEGYRVQTYRNYFVDIPLGTTTSATNTIMQLSYDNYVLIKEMGGCFRFNVGDTVLFYNSTKNFISNTALTYTKNTAPQGTLVATASMRSLTYVSGVVGTNSATYALYIFNVNTQPGQSFTNALSVYYNSGTIAGIADVVQTYSATSNSNITKIVGNNNSLVFSPGVGRIHSVSNVTYTYRSMNVTANVSNLGIGSISLSVNPNEIFPYTASLALSNSQLMSDIEVTPLSNNFIWSTPIGGTVSISSTNANLVGVGTSFSTDLSVGDYLVIANGAANDTHQVVAVVNNTLALMESNSVPGAMSGASAYHYMPPYTQVPFGSRSWLSANVDTTGTLLTLNFGSRFQGPTSANVAIAYNAERRSVSSGKKVAARFNSVLIDTANNTANSVGPWKLGVPDVLRLRGVWISDSSGHTLGNNITSSFYIETRHRADYIGESVLYLRPSSNGLNLTNKYMLVQFDNATISVPGFFTTDSYMGTNISTVITNDSSPSDQLGSAITSWEVPQFTSRGKYYDMLEWMDFRPSVKAVANLQAPSFTVNPGNSASFDISTDWKFPLPGSQLTATVSYYMGRVDSPTIDKNGWIINVPGTPSPSPAPAIISNSVLTLDQLYIPPYPTLPKRPSANVINAVATFTICSTLPQSRGYYSQISSIISTAPSLNTQPTAYTMASIGNLERRISALEYYVSLNSLEVAISQQALPSSISQSSSRFQYGFFADDFSTPAFANTSDTEWSATIYATRRACYPKSLLINLPHFITYAPSYVPQQILSQPMASYAPVVVNVVSNVVVNVVSNVVVNVVSNVVVNTVVNVVSNVVVNTAPNPCPLTANTPCVWTSVGRESSLQDSYGGQVDYLYLRLCSKGTANVTMYFTTTSPYWQIWQENTIVATGNNAVALDANDSVYCQSIPYLNKSDYFYAQEGSAASYYNNFSPGNLSISANGDVSGAGKITWFHNPVNGVNYTITTETPYDNLWKYYVDYPIDGDLFTDCSNGVISTISVVAANLDGSSYLSNAGFNSSVSGINYPSSAIDPSSYVLQFNLAGLKAGSTYAFFLQETNVGPICAPNGGSIGGPLVADKNGNLSFYLFYYDFYMYSSVEYFANSVSSTILNYETTLESLQVEGWVGYVQATLQNVSIPTAPYYTYYVQFPVNFIQQEYVIENAWGVSIFNIWGEAGYAAAANPNNPAGGWLPTPNTSLINPKV